MVKWALIVLVSGFVFLGSFLFFRLGAYKDVSLLGPQTNDFHFIFKNHVGAYHNINTTIQFVENWAKRSNVSCLKTFGEYLDDPSTVDENRLRSLGGCLTNQSNDKLPDELHYKHVKAQSYLKLVFEGSPAIGPFKVYPKAKQWFEKNGKVIGGPVIEVYEITEDKKIVTEYFFPVKEPS